MLAIRSFRLWFCDDSLHLKISFFPHENWFSHNLWLNHVRSQHMHHNYADIIESAAVECSLQEIAAGLRRVGQRLA